MILDAIAFKLLFPRVLTRQHWVGTVHKTIQLIDVQFNTSYANIELNKNLTSQLKSEVVLDLHISSELVIRQDEEDQVQCYSVVQVFSDRVENRTLVHRYHVVLDSATHQNEEISDEKT